MTKVQALQGNMWGVVWVEKRGLQNNSLPLQPIPQGKVSLYSQMYMPQQWIFLGLESSVTREITLGTDDSSPRKNPGLKM